MFSTHRTLYTQYVLHRLQQMLEAVDRRLGCSVASCFGRELKTGPPSSLKKLSSTKVVPRTHPSRDGKHLRNHDRLGTSENK